MALNLFEQKIDENIQVMDRQPDINIFSSKALNIEDEYAPKTRISLQEAFAKYDKTTQNVTIQKTPQNLQEASKNPFFENEGFKTAQNMKQNLAIFRIKLIFSMSIIILTMLLGFMIYNFVAIGNLKRSIDINRIKIELKEEQTQNSYYNNFEYQAEHNVLLIKVVE